MEHADEHETPAAQSAPRPAAELREALLALNGRTPSFVVQDGTPEGVDLIAEWRFEDSRKPKTFRILMRLDDARHEVRAEDRTVNVLRGPDVGEGSTTWTRGTAHKASVSFEISRWRIVRRHRFSTDALRAPLQHATTAAGWTWRGGLS